MKSVFCANSDTGFYHAKNEDSICILSALISGKNVVMLVVCDGVGGLPMGNKASSTCILELTNWFCKELPEFMQSYYSYFIFPSLTKLFQSVNQKLFQNNQATTCSLFLAIERRYFVMHTGDSRIYLLNKKVKALTKDERMSGTNILTKCLGIGGQIVFYKKRGRIPRTCTVIAGTDGFFEKLPFVKYQKDVIHFECEKEMDKAHKKWIDFLRKNGEKDDITIGVIKFNGEEGFCKKK